MRDQLKCIISGQFALHAASPWYASLVVDLLLRSVLSQYAVQHKEVLMETLDTGISHCSLLGCGQVPVDDIANLW